MHIHKLSLSRMRMCGIRVFVPYAGPESPAAALRDNEWPFFWFIGGPKKNRAVPLPQDLRKHLVPALPGGPSSE
jgi:hypothetical protein